MRTSTSIPTTRCGAPVLALALFANAGVAQSQLEWLSTHDSPGGGDDRALRCAVTPSGELCVVGRSFDPSGTTSDVEVATFAPNGTELWSARVDALGGYEYIGDCLASPTGDIYIHGFGWRATGSDTDAYLMKLSSSGALQWVTGHAGPYHDTGYNITLDAAGNVLVCGSTSNGTDVDAFVESYSPTGVLNWSREIDGGAQGDDRASALLVLGGGEIVVAGSVSDAMNTVHATVWKLDSSGGVIWSKLVAPATVAGHVSIAPNEKLVIGGVFFPTVNSGDWFVAQLDGAAGTVEWTATYDGVSQGSDSVAALAVDGGGVVWACGPSDHLGTGGDIAVRRYSPTGAVLSSTTWNNAAVNLSDSPSALLLGSAGQAWVSGISTLQTSPYASDVVLAQLDASGAFDWVAMYSTTGAHRDQASDMAMAPANRVAIGGYTDGSPSGTFDYLALQIDLNESPQAYCTAKTTSNGCVPGVSFVGMPSASASSGFVVRTEQVRNNKSGLLFYGVNGAIANPFHGGTVCVAAPHVRTALQNSAGNAAPIEDCSGSFALDMNAYAADSLGGAPLPALQVPGTAVYCQFWGRDPGFAPQQSAMLSNALRYLVLP